MFQTQKLSSGSRGFADFHNARDPTLAIIASKPKLLSRFPSLVFIVAVVVIQRKHLKIHSRIIRVYFLFMNLQL